MYAEHSIKQILCCSIGMLSIDASFIIVAIVTFVVVFVKFIFKLQRN